MEAPLQEKLRRYYTQYYKDDCSIRDYEPLVQSRLSEESLERKKLKELASILGFSFQGQKHLIVGAGTGGLALVLRKEHGCDVYGIEPNPQALELIQERCQVEGIPPEHFTADTAERISFETGQFDFVHCYSVLEHVQNVEKSIDEMIRVTRPGGRIYIHTPNYRFPFEGHYKIPFPTFLPKPFGSLYLRGLGKSPSLLKTLNFLAPKELHRILLRKKDISYAYLYRTHSRHGGKLKPVWDFLFYRMNVYPYQEVVITKRAE